MAKPIPLPGGGAPEYAERFWSKAVRAGACLVWTGRLKPDGYGQFRIGKFGTFAPHRVAYRLAHGEIPAGLVVDHTCRNRACVEPAHLEAVSQRENILRGDSPEAARRRITIYNNEREVVA